MGNSSIICPANQSADPSQPSRATLGSSSKQQQDAWEGWMWWREEQLGDSLMPNVRKLQRYDRDRLVSAIYGRKEDSQGEYQHNQSRRQHKEMDSKMGVVHESGQQSLDKNILQSLERKYQQLVELRLQMRHKAQTQHHAKRQKSIKEYHSFVSHKQPKNGSLKI